MVGHGSRKPISPRMTWIDASHNPEVAGSNPAPATAKGPHTRAFCLPNGRQPRNFGPLFGTPSFSKVLILRFCRGDESRSSSLWGAKIQCAPREIRDLQPGR